MNNDNIKRENRAAMPRFLLNLALCAAAGAAAGFLGFGMAGRLSVAGWAFRTWITAMAPVLIPVWVALAGLTSLALYWSGRRRCLAAGADGDYPEDGDRLVGASLVAANAGIVGVLLLFTAALAGWEESADGLLLAVLGLAAGFVLFTLVQKAAVDLTRRLNPEKRGSVLEMNFQRKWLASCDEAERLYIYKCAFAAYRATGHLCLFLWVVMAIIQLSGAADMLAAAVSVLLIWGVQTIVYGLAAVKNGRGME